MACLILGAARASSLSEFTAALYWTGDPTASDADGHVYTTDVYVAEKIYL